MPYEINLASVERRLPKGFRLLESFRRFAAACRGRRTGDLGYFAIKGGKPSDLGFEVDGAVVPFFRLPDGGMVGFWFERQLAGATLIATCTAKNYAVDWYDFGLKRCPLAAKLRPALTRLRDGLGRGLEKSEISVWPDGPVFFEKNTELGKARAAR